jgi:hypothetical protein
MLKWAEIGINLSEALRASFKIHNQTFAVELKSPWIYLQNQGESRAKQTPAEGGPGDFSALSRDMWCLLEKVCIYFQENPE